MRKYSIGIGLLVLSGLILFQDFLPDLAIPFWRLIFLMGTGYFFCESLWKKEFYTSFFFGTWFFILLNNQFHFLTVSTGTIILGAVLACLGISFLCKPKRGVVSFIDGSRYSTDNRDTIFGSSTRYVQDHHFRGDDIDVVFGSTKVYFTEAIMAENKANLTIDSVFSDVKLYVPKDWRVEVGMTNVFSGVKNYSQLRNENPTLYVTGDLVFSQLTIYQL